jgi:hypothetical protein
MLCGKVDELLMSSSMMRLMPEPDVSSYLERVGKQVAQLGGRNLAYGLAVGYEGPAQRHTFEPGLGRTMPAWEGVECETVAAGE